MNETELATTILASAGLVITMSIFLLIQVIACWIIFTKAGKPGWASIVPIYNIIVYLDILNKPGWWIFLLLIPGVNLVITIILAIRLANSFGQGTGFGIGLWFLHPLFTMLLAFGNYKYTRLND